METKSKIDLIDYLEASDKLDIRLGQIVSAERVHKSDKMLKLRVIFGEEADEEKTVMTNIGAKVSPDDLLGAVMPFVVNLVPVKLMGVVSEAMILPPVMGDDMFLELNRIGSKLL
jgi:methionyl-tRNA synthetase